MSSRTWEARKPYLEEPFKVPLALQIENTELMASEDDYRSRWSWDRSTWGTHCLNCLATCPYKVYVRDEKILFEEQAGSYESITSRIPDMNPLGCQKGSSWSSQIYSKDRILYPLKRSGERGSGKWEKITWDEAINEISCKLLSTIREYGPESIVFEESVEGGLMSQMPFLRFASLIGAVTLDAQGLVNDLPLGQYITFGKFSLASSVDDTFESEVLLIWHSNPAYTSIPYYHYITEARYKGAVIITIAPDYSASCICADYFIPIKPATDAALALGLVKLIMDSQKEDALFLKSQSDLGFLVRTDTKRYLREREMIRGGSDERFFCFDKDKGISLVNNSSLALGTLNPELYYKGVVRLADNSEVEISTVGQMLKDHLRSYDVESVATKTGIAPENLIKLAGIIAGKKVKILEGFNAPKYYHGDLMERSMCLLLGVTGNWGKAGTGIQGLALAGFDGYMLFSMKTAAGIAETSRILDGIDQANSTARNANPDLSDEMIGNQMLQLSTAKGTSAPPFFFNYYHAGYRENWDTSDWNDPGMKKPFSSYFDEAIRKGWWGGNVRPGANNSPKVFFAVGTNPIRRTRGGSKTLLSHLWPNLDFVVVVDFRMSSTALWADIVLPCAMQYERLNVQYPITHTVTVQFSDKATEPMGEAKTEWEIFQLIAQRLKELSVEANYIEYEDQRRIKHRLDNLSETYDLNGAYSSEESIIDEWVRDSAYVGTVEPNASIATLRQKGSLRFKNLGIFAPGLSVAGDIENDRPMTAFTWHVEKNLIFPTLTRRAQFYIDHPWFIEAGEALPVHKDSPYMGGNFEFILTSGHSRWTVHASHMGNKHVLETHRGKPNIVISKKDAVRLGIKDGDSVRVFNDHGEFTAMVKIAGRVQPCQAIIYNGYEPHLFSGWNGSNEVEPGMVKWLHMVGKYGHLRYLPFGWQPVPIDRAVRVGIEPEL